MQHDTTENMLIVMTEEKPKFFMCTCTSHAISAGMCNVFVDDKLIEFPEIELAIWQHPQSRTILDRLRWIWTIIRNGDPYGDFVILDIGEATRLRNHLTKLINRIEESSEVEEPQPHEPQKVY